MGRKKKPSPAQKASARWDDKPDSENAQDKPAGKEEPSNGDHFVISLALIGVVAVATVVYTTMQGGPLF